METVTIEMMDQAAIDLRAKKEISDNLKQKYSEAYAETEAAKNKLMELMDAAGKTDYICEGVGKVKINSKLSYKVPKSIDDKVRFFNWLESNMGADVRMAYQTINSASLNSLCNQLSEEYAERGELLEIAGLELPTEYKRLSFTKA